MENFFQVKIEIADAAERNEQRRGHRNSIFPFLELLQSENLQFNLKWHARLRDEILVKFKINIMFKSNALPTRRKYFDKIFKNHGEKHIFR